ncbi:MAG TPA: AAA family ATPase [Oligoflexia bacterium]|nr:AAA family ATPase [Oligoflexia bacterium]HMP48001.1 AAA family ATPase [Oligoflexia bacterium]
MRVSRLEIFGFKSFVERFVLNFDKNMIGIVGPNGCGKSNVVDALRWVLGETQAKQLRGGSFEDLIFNGSDGKRPLGMAEVSLTIQPDSKWIERANKNIDLDEEIDQLESAEVDNSTSSERINLINQKVLDIPGLLDVAEIQFTRRLYRSGESEYFINKVPCRLRDMQDVYRLIGLGARGLSIVQQGQIGQFISKKPSERRELLEEAAGISGFRTKMEAAIRRLERTDDNLKRLSDIILEVEKQVRVLRRQAQRARVRQDLKDELHAAEKDLFMLKSARLITEIYSGNLERSTLERKLEEGGGEIQEQDAKISEFEAELHDAEVNIQSLRREKDQCSRSLMELEARLQNTRVKLASLESNRNYLNSRLLADKKRKEDIKIHIDINTTELDRLTKQASVSEEAVRNQKKKLDELLVYHANKIQKFVEESSFSDGLKQEADGSTGSQISSLKIRIEELEESLRDAELLRDAANSDSKTLKNIEKEKSDTEKILTAIDSEIKAIEKQLETFTEHTLQVTGRSFVQSDTGERVLLSVIKVPEEYERALQGALGERAEFLISSQSTELLRDYLKNSENSAQKRRIGVLNKDHFNIAKDNLEQTLLSGELPFGISPLANVIEVEPGFEGVVNKLLNGVFVASDIDVAFSFREQLRNVTGDIKDNFLIVLKSGALITPWGWYSTEGEGVNFSFTRRLSKLKDDREGYVKILEDISQRLNQVEDRLSATREKIDLRNNSRLELHQLQKDLSDLFRRQGEENRRQAEELRSKERNLRNEFQVIEREEALILSNTQQTLAKIISDTDAVRRDIERLKREDELLESSNQECIFELSRIEEEIKTTTFSVTQAAQAASSDSSREDQNKIRMLEGQIEEQENLRLGYLKQIGEIRYGQSELRRVRESLERTLRQISGSVDKAQVELDLMTEDIRKYYPEDDSFSLIDEPTARSLMQEKGGQIDRELERLLDLSGSLRRRLEREGEVDPQSIELCEIEEQRLESMNRQMEDLTSAKATLERTIKQLKELSRIRFLNTFTVVSEKFEQLVPRLFGGGSGHLELINPDDPLQSGINIVVRPPGKKITTMELLSGGEKALVATAVLVSVYLYHPGPICVLDEVDAPLDDANLERFLELIREISDKTQFLLITHNKLSMQAVDRLIGITMQESGVTTAITVNLEDAASEIEKWAVNG